MKELVEYLRAEADRHASSIASRDSAVSKHVLNLRQWADYVDALPAAQPGEPE